MKTLENSQDKIQKICDKLKRQTLEPAEEAARKIIEDAKKEAEEIKAESLRHAEQILKQAKAQIEQERSVFHSSLQQSSKQAVESLRQEIEHKFFNEELKNLLDKPLNDPKIVAELINGIVKALEKDGLKTDLVAIIPRLVSANDVIPHLLEEVKKRFNGKPVEIGNFNGGAQVKISGKKMTVDLSDQAVKELLANYMRKDFRSLIFS